MPNYRILTLKPFLENPPLGSYIPYTQLTASVFYCSFSPKSELASVLWINIDGWPWGKDCVLGLSLMYTFAFSSPRMWDGPQNRGPVIWFLTHLLPTTGEVHGLYGCCWKENKEGQTSISTEAIVTSKALGCTPNLCSTFLQRRWSEREEINQCPHLSSLP